MNRLKRNLILGMMTMATFVPVIAQDQPIRVGRETHLPIPRFVSLKAGEANMRVGPGQEYRIEWVYHRPNLPVKVIAESGHWRKVEDFEGESGWFYYTLLSGRRTVLVTAEKISLYADAKETSSLNAILANGVVANLEQCSLNWCQIEADGNEGWVPKTAIWGVDAEEVFEN